MQLDSGSRCGRSDAFLSVIALNLAFSCTTLSLSHTKTEVQGVGLFVFNHWCLLPCDKPELPQRIMVKPVVIHPNLLNYLSGSKPKIPIKCEGLYSLLKSSGVHLNALSRSARFSTSTSTHSTFYLFYFNRFLVWVERRAMFCWLRCYHDKLLYSPVLPFLPVLLGIAIKSQGKLTYFEQYNIQTSLISEW